LIPLKDNVPTSRLPLVTILLIVVNVGFFIWQLSFSGSANPNPEVQRLGISERDEISVQYGAIPDRILHPGRDCAFGVPAHPGESDIVCQGTRQYSEGLAAHRACTALTPPSALCGEPFVRYPNPPWYVTVFTSMFMHGGFLHIAFNMLFLWIFGNNVEDAMGWSRYLLFYLLAGIAAVYSQAAIDPSGTLPSIGASGAIAGVLGAYAVLLPRARILTLVFLLFFVTLVEIPAYVMLGIWFVLQFIPAIGQVAVPNVGGQGGVAYFAHVGGFAFGLALVKLFVRRRPRIPAPIGAGW
jgi:membrane associated rhomboid family serine protease